MNNTKQMISEAAADFPSPTAATKRKRQKSSRQQQPVLIGSEIRNLPGKLIVTPEILKTNVCRVCATYYDSEKDFVPLFNSYTLEAGPRLADIMNTMLPIKKVRKHDGLPQYACRTCANQLIAWRKLCDGVVEAQKILISQTTQLIRDFNYSANDSRTLHFVDLMDSSDEETPSPAPPPAPPPPPPPVAAPGEETVFRYIVFGIGSSRGSYLDEAGSDRW